MSSGVSAVTVVDREAMDVLSDSSYNDNITGTVTSELQLQDDNDIFIEHRVSENIPEFCKFLMTPWIASQSSLACIPTTRSVSGKKLYFSQFPSTSVLSSFHALASSVGVGADSVPPAATIDDGDADDDAGEGTSAYTSYIWRHVPRSSTTSTSSTSTSTSISASASYCESLTVSSLCADLLQALKCRKTIAKYMSCYWGKKNYTIRQHQSPISNVCDIFDSYSSLIASTISSDDNTDADVTSASTSTTSASSSSALTAYKQVFPGATSAASSRTLVDVQNIRTMLSRSKQAGAGAGAGSGVSWEDQARLLGLDVDALRRSVAEELRRGEREREEEEEEEDSYWSDDDEGEEEGTEENQ
jgi:hypothetical protein